MISQERNDFLGNDDRDSLTPGLFLPLDFNSYLLRSDVIVKEGPSSVVCLSSLARRSPEILRRRETAVKSV